MGWTSFHAEPGAKPLDVLRDEFGAGYILAGRMKRGAAYLACQTEPDGPIFGAVVLVRRYQEEFSYKVVTEDMGPSDSHCPAEILDMLDPEPPSEYAAAWRTRCRESLDRADHAKRVNPGAWVRFAEPMEFSDGFTRDTFRFVRYSTFVASDGVQVRVTNWRTRKFEIVSSPLDVLDAILG